MEARTFDRCTALVGAAGVALLLCLPLVAVHRYQLDSAGSHGPVSGEVTVGIAVILRATVRRFMRTASNQFMRTAFGVVGRASARAATRRVVKAATKVTIAMALQRDAQEKAVETEEPRRQQPAWLALSVGGLALAASFAGILQLVSPDVAAQLLHGDEIAAVTACAYVAVPMMVYALFHALFGRMFGVQISYRTDLEGLLLQGYFTGSGSFLPMTTDVEYAGSAKGSARVAAGALLGMLVVHLACMAAARATGNVHLEFVGAAFLIYAFIYVFPISPLEGTFIWRVSKLAWLVVAAPILAAFLYFLPVSFGEIL